MSPGRTSGRSVLTAPLASDAGPGVAGRAGLVGVPEPADDADPGTGVAGTTLVEPAGSKCESGVVSACPAVSPAPASTAVTRDAPVAGAGIWTARSSWSKAS